MLLQSNTLNMTLTRLVLLFLTGTLIQASALPVDDFADNEFLNLLADTFEPFEDTFNILKNSLKGVQVQDLLMKLLLGSKPWENDACHKLRQESLPKTKQAVETAFGETTKAKDDLSNVFSKLTNCFSWNPIGSATCFSEGLDEAKDKFNDNKDSFKQVSQKVSKAVLLFNNALLDCVNTL